MNKNEQKSFQNFLQSMSQEQLKKTSDKLEMAIKHIAEDGMVPYEALGMPNEVLEFIYSEGYRYYKTGFFNKSQQLFEVLIFLNPSDPKFVLGEAASLQMGKQYEAAIQTYHILSRMMPDSPLPYFYIYECSMQLNAYEDAREALNQVIARAETDPRYFSQMGEKAKMMLEGHNILYPKEDSKVEHV